MVTFFARRGCGVSSPNDGLAEPANQQPVAVVVQQDGRIADVALGDDAWKIREEAKYHQDSVLVEGELLVPGFVDIHTHGLGGTADAVDYWTVPGFTQKHLASMGTTSFLASVVFQKDQSHMATVLKHLLPRIGEQGHGAILEGIHAEGPCVHDLGAMPDRGEVPSPEWLREWIDNLPPGVLKMMTISPRVEAAVGYARLKCLLENSVLPALGHDRVASEDDILGALKCCPERRLHITHLYNVSNFHHRLPSLVNFGLVERFPDLPQYSGLSPPTVELIGDLAHVHPLTVKCTLSARHPSNIAFISDAIALPEANRRTAYAGRHLVVSSDAKTVKLEGTDTLAGSCASLLETFRNLVNVLGVSEEDASSMLSTTPARIVGLEHVGKIEVGRRADFLLLDKNYELKQTVIAGRLAYTAAAAE
ncbi:N-acetylglucosamine-6-phosphate deacetylase-like [Sycon ciliatum]|uniref:N-acetylglucosamine-6-phosphate deacetylase-like n=1 Tax=Sycon ciliatum TaxID=27933 RepID=UPI0031F6B915